MSNVWCARADSGQFSDHFLRGQNAGIGWSKIAQDLRRVRSRDELSPLVRAAYPDELDKESNVQNLHTSGYDLDVIISVGCRVDSLRGTFAAR